MSKPTVAVVFGSRSTEHDISIITAISAVIKPLELTHKYHILPVYITKGGQWYSHPKLADIKLYQSGKLDSFLARQKPLAVLFDRGLTLVSAEGLRRQTHKVDIVFPALHGTHGEDGELMAVCELAGVPYVGCGTEASVIAMDKVLAKQVVASAGLDTPKFVYFSKHDFIANRDNWLKQINEGLSYPLFVKPAHLGSSIGITRVDDKKELANAIEVALHYDDKALVEEAVPNLTEVTLPIIGNNDLTPAYLEQPAHQDDFFTFETKYMKGGKKGEGGKAKSPQQGSQGYSTIPAPLPDKLYKKAETVGLDAYRAFGCSGIARIDMLINSKTEQVYFNEVNPLPGSLYSHNWRQKGVSNVELVTRLIDLAVKRHEERQALNTVFSTNFLKQF